MRIEIRCTCDAFAIFADRKNMLINTDGTPDKRGRKYIIELKIDQWLEIHKHCIPTHISRKSVPATETKEEV